MGLDKSELKKSALDSMNEAGAAFETGNYQEALDKASQAWNCYYKLQGMRGEDEDYTDLIYWARDLYQKAEAALKEQEAEEEDTDDEEKYDPALYYPEIQKLALGGFAGNPSKAIQAARWYVDPRNWVFLQHRGVDFLGDATKLLQKVLDNQNAAPGWRAIAACEASKMYRKPMYTNVNMNNARAYAEYSVNEALKDDDISKEDLFDIFNNAMYVAMCVGAIEYGGDLVKLSVKKGLGWGVAYEMCTYGYRHDEKTAPQLEEKMYEEGCWQGMLLHAQTLIEEWNPEKEETEDALREFVNEKLSLFADENSGTPGGNACMGAAIYGLFVLSCDDDTSDFYKSEFMDFIVKAADQMSDWALFYQGLIYYVCLQIKQDTDADKDMWDTLRKAAYPCFKMAAGLGHRGGLKYTITMLKEGGVGDPAEIPQYEEYARVLDVKMD